MNPNNHKQLRKLINAGYPLYTAIVFFIVAAVFASQIAWSLLSGKTLEPGGLIILIVVLAITLGLGWILWKIGMEAKEREDAVE